MVNFLTKQDFIDKIFNYKNNKEWNFKGKKPAIIDFYADWCGPCRTLAPIYEEISMEYDDKIDFYKVDIDKEQEILAPFGIKSVPTIFFIPLNGEPKIFSGVIQKEVFKSFIKDLFKI